jgi:hypothetical protein
MQDSTTAPLYRHPLGLPAGSVRATLTLMIVGLFWLLQLTTDDRVPIPLYLYFLLGLVLVFFGAHGHTIAPASSISEETLWGSRLARQSSQLAGISHASPWWLPRGTFRWLIFLGSLGINGWLLYSEPDRLIRRLTPESAQLEQWPALLAALVGGFGLGWLIRLGPWKRAPWFQDIQAWISLLAMLGLGAEILIRLFINPNLELPLNLPLWESILVGIVSFYFGVRS